MNLAGRSFGVAEGGYRQIGGDMPSTEEGRENGSALMVMGWVCVLFAFMVMFFNPAALKRGHRGIELIAGRWRLAVC